MSFVQTRVLSRVLFVVAGSLVLSALGCSSGGSINQNGGPLPQGAAKRPNDRDTFTIWSLPRTANGAQYPSGNLVEAGGKLYGIAEGGDDPQAGTIFSVGGGQGPRTVYRFKSRGDDGDRPNDDLIAVKEGGGVFLYGTTSAGGAYNNGTIFKYDVQNEKESIVYSFHGDADGAGPGAGVSYIDGTLYGTTRHAGEFGKGGLYKFRLPDGKAGLPVILHQFGPMPDVADVEAPMTYRDGKLWGVSREGGEFKGPRGSFDNGYGTIFAFGLDGSGGTCASANGDDLLQPHNALVVAPDGFVVSTGDSFNDPDGFVYALNGCRPYIPRGAKVPTGLGSNPSGTLLTISAKHDTFGTLYSGGRGGTGTFYVFDRQSWEALHSFTGEPGKQSEDGCKPQATPVFFAGSVYGTTRLCGKDGVGTVWSWTGSIQ